MVRGIEKFFSEHKGIQWDKAELYRNDNVHMSDMGNGYANYGEFGLSSTARQLAKVNKLK